MGEAWKPAVDRTAEKIAVAKASELYRNPHVPVGSNEETLNVIRDFYAGKIPGCVVFCSFSDLTGPLGGAEGACLVGLAFTSADEFRKAVDADRLINGWLPAPPRALAK